MDFKPNKTTVKIIKEVVLDGLILETFILVLIVNGTKPIFFSFSIHVFEFFN